MEHAVLDEDHVSHLELVRWLSGVHAFTTAVNRPASLRQLLDLVTATACDLLGYDFCGILLLNAEQRRLVMEGSHGFSVDYAHLLSAQMPQTPDVEHEAPSMRAFRTTVPCVVNDVDHDPIMTPWRQLAAQQGYRSLASAPLLIKGRPIGVLNCYSSEPNSFNNATVELISILANQVAAAIEAIHLRDQQSDYIATLASANHALRQHQDLLEQAEQIHQRLNEVALSAGGIDGVATALGELLNRPVMVTNAVGYPMLEASGYSVRIDIDPAECADFYEARASGDGAPHVIARVSLSGEVIAHIVIPGALDELDPLQFRALEASVTITALELLRQRTAIEAEWRLQGNLVNTLIQGNISDHSSLSRRGLQLGFDLSEPHYVLLIEIASGTLSAVSTQTIRRVQETVSSFVRNRQSAVLLNYVEPHLVLVLPANMDPGTHIELADQLRTAVSWLLGGGPVSASLGPECTDVSEYQRSFRVARGALEIHGMRNESARTVTPDGVGVIGLLLQTSDTVHLMDFVSQHLQALRDYDVLRSTNLMKTLDLYFARHCSIKETADQLFVHVNTVKLRLRRIESLLGISLSDMDDMVELRTAFLVDQVVRSRNSPPDISMAEII